MGIIEGKDERCERPESAPNIGGHLLEFWNDKHRQQCDEPAGDRREHQQDCHHVMRRAADGVRRDAQHFAAGGQDIFQVAELFAGAKDGGDLRRQKARDFFERLAQPVPAFDVRGHHVKVDADGAVMIFRGGKNGLFHRLAALQDGFQQIEKKQGAVAPVHRQREQIMNQHRKSAARQQDEHCIPKQGKDKLWEIIHAIFTTVSHHSFD